MRKGNHDITFKDDNINLACHVGNIEFPMFPGQTGNIPTLTFYGGCFLATVNVIGYCDPYMDVAIHDLDDSSVEHIEVYLESSDCWMDIRDRYIKAMEDAEKDESIAFIESFSKVLERFKVYYRHALKQ